MMEVIQNVEDVKKAVTIGCDGIGVSSHAGRQVYGAVVDALEEIVKGRLSMLLSEDK